MRIPFRISSLSLAVAALLLSSCGRGLPKSVLETTWSWRDTTYTIYFRPDEFFAVRADCNQLIGGYQVSGDHLTLRTGPSTAADCGPESSHDEYVGLLRRVDGFETDGDQLILTYGDGAGQMVFSKVDGGD